MFYSNEIVFRGHPDKACDQISDAILDACLEQDKNSRVAVETFISNGQVSIAGQITSNANIDIEKNKELIKAAGNMSVTFHRAFDMCCDPFESLERIVSLGFDRILTSGQQPKAIEGIRLIKDLVKVADNRIIIMPGSGVTANNIAQIARNTGAKEFHLSARESIKSGMLYRNPNFKTDNTTVVINEFEEHITSSEKVRQTIDALNAL